MAKYDDFDDVRLAVEGHGGILTVHMGELRDAHGADRLGRHVRDAIRKALANRGLGHVPSDLPEYQREKVRLYVLGSRFADCLKDIDDLSPEADERLREIFLSNYEEIVSQIRQLICD